MSNSTSILCAHIEVIRSSNKRFFCDEKATASIKIVLYSMCREMSIRNSYRLHYRRKLHHTLRSCRRSLLRWSSVLTFDALHYAMLISSYNVTLYRYVPTITFDTVTQLHWQFSRLCRLKSKLLQAGVMPILSKFSLRMIHIYFSMSIS